MTRVAVIGGGITGLSAAWFLRGHADVSLYEATDRLGGKIRTDDFAGRRIEAGPDAFLARVPHAVDLCRAAGLGDRLVAPATGKAYVWANGALRELPAGTVLGAPTNLRALADSGLVSRGGVARAALDLVLPRTGFAHDIGVGDLVAARYGRQVRDHLIDPLLGGIHTGPSQRLSAAATAPQLFAAATTSRSLIRGLRAAMPATPSRDPVFQTVAGGLSQLVDRLAASITDTRLNTAVAAVERDGARWRVDGDMYDAVIVTTPSFAAAPLLRAIAPTSGRRDGCDRVCVDRAHADGVSGVGDAATTRRQRLRRGARQRAAHDRVLVGDEQVGAHGRWRRHPAGLSRAVGRGGRAGPH